MATAHRQSRLGIQLRVLFALIMREMVTRYGRSAGGYIWAIVEPIFIIALLSVVFAQIGRYPPLGSNFIFFFATGYLPFHMYKDISGSVSMAVASNRALLNFPRITMFDLIIARFILQFLTSITVFFVIIFGIIQIFDISTQLRILPIMSSIIMAALLGVGIGALNCVLFAFSPTWKLVFNIINRPLFIISGTIRIYEELSRETQDILWWNPLVHITAIMRRGFYAEYHAAFVSPMYVLFVSLLSLMLGILLLRVLRTQVMEIIDG